MAQIRRFCQTRIILGKRRKIGKDCVIGPNTYIKDGVIGNNVVLDNVKLLDSEVEDGTDCGPFVKIRAGSKLGKGVHIGNFVEVKNSVCGRRHQKRTPHIYRRFRCWQNVNFGCGTVTVNYDGKISTAAKSAIMPSSAAIQILWLPLKSAIMLSPPQAAP